MFSFVCSFYVFRPLSFPTLSSLPSGIHNRHSFFLSSLQTYLSMEESKAGKDVKAPNLFERAKDEIEAIVHKEKKHDKETHGTSNDIDENTPIDEIKGPSVFERAKEEIEALVETIHPKKEPDHEPHTKKEGGFWGFLGRRFEKFCSPSNGKRN